MTGNGDAAASCGLAGWCTRPWRPAKLRFEVEMQRAPAGTEFAVNRDIGYNADPRL
jgi:hypothetical protein